MERDDIYEYAIDHQHDEAQGKIIRKNIIKVTLILSLLTAIEVAMGIFFKNDGSSLWMTIKVIFILLTVVKAGYIVMVFMHMREEHKHLQDLILITYYAFILYMTTLMLHEGWMYGKTLIQYGAY